MGDSPPLSTCDESSTIFYSSRLQNQHNQHKQRVSRAGLVYGSSFSRGSCLDGTNRLYSEPEDMWYDSERFQLVSLNLLFLP